MKRSEMIDKLSRLLYRGQGYYANRKLAIYDANDILNELEELGMMMTTVEKLGNGLDIRQISYWEDEAKGIDWETAMNTKINPKNGEIILPVM